MPQRKSCVSPCSAVAAATTIRPMLCSLLQDKAENLRWEHEIVEQRYMRLAAERDALFERFQAALHDVKQKTGFKTLLLEKRITATAAEAERTTIALSEVLAAAHLDSAVVGHLEAQIGDVIGAKDAAIAELETELARVVGAAR